MNPIATHILVITIIYYSDSQSSYSMQLRKCINIKDFALVLSHKVIAKYLWLSWFWGSRWIRNVIKERHMI